MGNEVGILSLSGTEGYGISMRVLMWKYCLCVGIAIGMLFMCGYYDRYVVYVWVQRWLWCLCIDIEIGKVSVWVAR